MEEIGPLLQLHEVLASSEGPSWSLQWDDGLVVIADYDDDDQRVTLTAHVGAMPTENSHELADLILRFNGLWYETGGLRLGLDDVNIVQIYDLFAVNLDSPTLCTLVTRFAEKARAWIRIVESHDSSASSAASASAHQESILDMFSTGIRA